MINKDNVLRLLQSEGEEPAVKQKSIDYLTQISLYLYYNAIYRNFATIIKKSARCINRAVLYCSFVLYWYALSHAICA